MKYLVPFHNILKSEYFQHFVSFCPYIQTKVCISFKKFFKRIEGDFNDLDDKNKRKS